MEQQHLDGVLRMLTTVVNGIGAEGDSVSLSITLTVSGLVVTGDLVSAQEYFDGLVRDVGEHGDLLRQALVSGDRVFSEPVKVTNPVEQDLPFPAFVHLRNARIFQPVGKRGELIPAGIGGWYRCRLQAIDGFGVGSLSVANEESATGGELGSNTLSAPQSHQATVTPYTFSTDSADATRAALERINRALAVVRASGTMTEAELEHLFDLSRPWPGPTETPDARSA